MYMNVPTTKIEQYSLCEISFFVLYSNIPNCIIKYIWFLHLSLETNHYFCITLYADFFFVYMKILYYLVSENQVCVSIYWVDPEH